MVSRVFTDGLPLSERRAKLVELLPESEVIRISQAYATSGTEFFEAAGKLNLEGIMAKKEDAVYARGKIKRVAKDKG